MVQYSHLFNSFPQFIMMHTGKVFSIVNETEVDVFRKFPCFLYDPANDDNLISGSSPFLNPAWTPGSSLVHILLKTCMKDFKDDPTSMGDERNCIFMYITVCIYVKPVCLVTQLCPTLCDPMDYSPPGSSVHGDSPGKNTGVGCHALLQGIFPTQRLNPGLPFAA